MACGKFHKASKANWFTRGAKALWGGIRKGWNYLTGGQAAQDLGRVQNYVQQGQRVFDAGVEAANNMGFDTTKVNNFGQKTFGGINKGLNTAGNVVSHLSTMD